MRDPYLVLNVAREAGEAEIRGAYRRLVKRYHPDLNPDDHAAAARFREIQAAYALLKDKTQRARFDAGEIDAKGQPLFRSVKPDFRRAAEAAGAGAGVGAAKQGWHAASARTKSRPATPMSFPSFSRAGNAARAATTKKSRRRWSISR